MDYQELGSLLLRKNLQTSGKARFAAVGCNFQATKTVLEVQHMEYGCHDLKFEGKSLMDHPLMMIAMLKK